jgi:Transmembrane domain of unknown function (DUF3566)
LPVVSPSKRAGSTVESSIDRDQGGANGDGTSNGDVHDADDGGTNGSARPRRRSVVSPAQAPMPERGSASMRGASSSSITKRSVTGAPTAFPDDEPTVGEVVEEPAVEEPAVVEPLVVEPAVEEPVVVEAAPSGELTEATTTSPATIPPPTARVDPNARRPLGPTHHTVVPTPLPITVPDAPPASVGPASARSGSELIAPGTPMAPPDAPYVTTTLSSHQVAPVPRLVGRRPRVRRVTRVVRQVDPWSVFKLALVFNLVLYIVLLTAGVLLWNVAYATGTVDNLERFFESFGWSSFKFHGGAIFHAAWIAGLFGVIGLTGAAVLGATLFNLITDLVGGVRLTVLEEEVQERTMAPMRRFVVRRPTAPNGGDPAAGLRREVDRLETFPDPPLPTTDT